MTIKAIFDEIAAESGDNKKMAILKKYEDNELLKRVLYLANSKRVKFYIKQIPAYEKAMLESSLYDALKALDLLSSRQLTGGAGITHLAAVLSLCTSDDAYIVERIIEKDCKIGMGTTYINKIFPSLIEDTPYMGAKAFKQDLVKKLFDGGKGAYSQVKMDGRYCNAIIRSGEVELESRQGEKTMVDGAAFLKELAGFKDDCVLNGELTMTGVSRYESNGIIASIISIQKKQVEGKDIKKEIAKFESKHMPYQEALDAIQFTVWDKISVDEYFTAKSAVPYDTRLNSLIQTLTDEGSTKVKLIEYKLVKSFDEAIAHFKEVLARGEEGTIVKSLTGTWKDGKPNWQVKLKKEIDLDLKIVKYNYGTGKNSNVISSIDVESSDGLLKTSPTGMKEDIMQYVTDNQDKLMGTILELTCSGLSQNSDKEYSVLHPRVKSFRDDKVTANSLAECIAIDAASTFL